MTMTLNNKYKGWMITRTDCYPNAYKIYKLRTKNPHLTNHKLCNATWRYFPTVDEAKDKIDLIVSRGLLTALHSTN